MQNNMLLPYANLFQSLSEQYQDFLMLMPDWVMSYDSDKTEVFMSAEFFALVDYWDTYKKVCKGAAVNEKSGSFYDYIMKLHI